MIGGLQNCRNKEKGSSAKTGRVEGELQIKN